MRGFTRLARDPSQQCEKELLRHSLRAVPVDAGAIPEPTVIVRMGEDWQTTMDGRAVSIPFVVATWSA